jgi:hypothetical protein
MPLVARSVAHAVNTAAVKTSAAAVTIDGAVGP